MENRSIEHEEQNESALIQPTAEVRRALTSGIDDVPLGEDDLHLLIEFFRLLDCWDRQEVVQ